MKRTLQQHLCHKYESAEARNIFMWARLVLRPWCWSQSSVSAVQRALSLAISMEMPLWDMYCTTDRWLVLSGLVRSPNHVSQSRVRRQLIGPGGDPSNHRLRWTQTRSDDVPWSDGASIPPDVMLHIKGHSCFVSETGMGRALQRKTRSRRGPSRCA